MEDMMNPFSSMDPKDLFADLNIDDGGDNAIIDNPGSLQRMIRGSDNTLWGSDMKYDKQASQRKRGFDANTLAKLQEIAEQEASGNDDYNDDSANERLELGELMGKDYEDVSYFLNEDDYMRASRAIQGDGSLPEYIFENDNIFDNNNEQQQARPKLKPKEKEEDDDDDLTMRDLMDSLKQRDAIPDDDGNRQAKEIRDRVFSQEPAFASQNVDSEEYKLYEEALSMEALSMGMMRNNQDTNEEDELDRALDGLQEMINAKNRGGEIVPQTRTEDDTTTNEGNLDEESSS